MAATTYGQRGTGGETVDKQITGRNGDKTPSVREAGADETREKKDA